MSEEPTKSAPETAPRHTQYKTAPFLTKEARRTVLRRLPWLVLIPIGLLLPRLFARYPAFVEQYYTQAIYPTINTILRSITGILPFSIAEWLLYLLVLLLPGYLVYRALRACLGYDLWLRFVHACMTYLILFGITLNAFYICWGFNYMRPTLGTLLELDVRERSVEELHTLCISLAETAVMLREEAKEDADGVYMLPSGTPAMLRKIPQAYTAMGKEIPLFQLRAARPKVVRNSEAMSWAGISGIYIPFTAEPNVNTHQPALLLPTAAAHESAHGLGIARENEANFVAYLACLRAEDAYIRYSGVMLALIHSGNQLHSANPALYQELYTSYSEAMRRDLAAHSAYWKVYEGPVEQTMDRVNDSYLKHNRQESGVKSYGEMVDLLLAWQEKRGSALG